MNNEILPSEAINLEPLSRFKYREAKICYDDHQMSFEWLVRCGHRNIHEYCGTGATLEEALFNAGIDQPPTFTD